MEFFSRQRGNHLIWVLRKMMYHNCSVNWMYFVDRKKRTMRIGRRKHGEKNTDENFVIDFFVDFSWVRFEEIAESVLGRWSKPHVATLMQSALLDLKSLIDKGSILLNVNSTDLPSLSRTYR